MDGRRIAALELLERIRRHEIQTEASELGQLRAEAAELERRREALERQLEDGVSCDDPAVLSYLGNFVRSVRAEIDLSTRQLAAIETRVEALSTLVGDKFRDIKSYEILRREAMARNAAEKAAREEAEAGSVAQSRWWSNRGR